MGSFIDLLAANDLLLLFTVIGLGYLIGNIKVFGFNLGVAAVLFVGIAFSAIDPRLALPDHIYVIGLVLFVYAVGLQAGPGFFASFHRRGLRISVIAALILAGGAIVAGLVGGALGLSAASIAGLYCGSLTNTPALAAAVEATKNMAAAFYEALLIRRTSLGEALALARRSVREGEPDLDELVTRTPGGGVSSQDTATPRSAGWAGMVLYGDPTPTVLQRLSPSDTSDSGRRKPTSLYL